MMTPKFNFENLFIFEIANNHQGSLEHGLKIVREMAELAKTFGVRGAVKLQFRNLDSIIHPDFKNLKNNQYMERFISTKLAEEDFEKLVDEVKNAGLISMVTPFDEPSVDLIDRLGVEIIKIGSPSNQDWPLLERVAEANKPVICSTGGLAVSDIDAIVSFFNKRAVDFALMHCVSLYPTPNDKLYLNQIETMKNRYPNVTIGFSTHEDPNNLNAIRVAYAKGARFFEKHVGMKTDEIKLNAYSATPEQVRAWLAAYKEAVESIGDNGKREISEKEQQDLKTFVRGVWAWREIKAGENIRKEDVFFAMPFQDGQLISGNFHPGLVANRNYSANEAIDEAIRPNSRPKKEIVYHAIHAVKGMLNEARVPLGHDFQVELSHHYGIDRFREIGSTIITCFNKEYAKKVIVALPGQWNPEHYHKKKDETFQILKGILEVEINGRKKILEPGDSLWIPRGVLHGFGSGQGAVFEEISTTDYNDDSFYTDRSIAAMNREDRKTKLLNWGQHQLDAFEEDELRAI